MRIGQAATIHDVPAVVAGLVGAIKEMDLVAASTNGEPRGRDPPRRSEIALDLNAQRFGDRSDDTILRSMPPGVVHQTNRVHESSLDMSKPDRGGVELRPTTTTHNPS